MSCAFYKFGYVKTTVRACRNLKQDYFSFHNMSTSKECLNFLPDQPSFPEGKTYHMIMGEYLIYYRVKVVMENC